MKNLYEAGRQAEVKERLLQLTPNSERHWGKMSAAQMVAHCSVAFEMATGIERPPRMFMGRLIGGLIKSKVLNDDAPLRKNSPTAKELVVSDERNLEAERTKLNALIDKFVAAGPAGCTTHPHSFFGPLTSDQWAVLMYKHLDHHLRQFGV